MPRRRIDLELTLLELAPIGAWYYRLSCPGLGNGSKRYFPTGKGWRVRVKLSLPDGRRLEVSKKSPLDSKTASRAWALELEKAMWAEAMTPKVIERPLAPTIAEFASRFLDYLRSRRRAPATIAAYDVALRCHIVPAVGGVHLHAIEPDTHEKLLKALAN